MLFLGIDLGGTKLAIAVFSADGSILLKQTTALAGRKGVEVAQLIIEQVAGILHSDQFTNRILSVGISVPGISNRDAGTVWAPNIPGWEAFPLYHEVKNVIGTLPLSIEGDRSCYILGELWKGAAQSCKDAIYLAVGTGIGAGIVADGHVLRGSNGISGAVGWMALERPFKNIFSNCGCFEYHASGNGIANIAQKVLMEETAYNGMLKNISVDNIRAQDVFAAYNKGDSLAIEIIEACVAYWGMAIANLISIFNPQKIILGGGVFGPAIQLIPAIKAEAARWAQPISMQQVSIEASQLGSDAGVIGAGFLALQSVPLPH